MTIINPYREAASDQRIIQRHRRVQTAFCCKCSQEKTLAGGKFPGRGARFTGVVSRFVCADCATACTKTEPPAAP